MKNQTIKVKRCFSGFQRGLFTKSPLWRGLGRRPMNTADSCLQPKASRRHVRRPFDALRANDEKPNNKSQTLFFGITKGTFYKKSPWAGFGAEPHYNSLIAACSRRAWTKPVGTAASLTRGGSALAAAPVLYKRVLIQSISFFLCRLIIVRRWCWFILLL